MLVYYYTSFQAAKVMAKRGIPALDLIGDNRAENDKGIVFSLYGPHELDKDASLGRSKSQKSIFSAGRTFCFSLPLGLMLNPL